MLSRLVCLFYQVELNSLYEFSDGACADECIVYAIASVAYCVNFVPNCPSLTSFWVFFWRNLNMASALTD